MSELFTFEGFKKSDLCHHGIKGQKWGVRRFQNPDGSLTPAGIKRYRKLVGKDYNIQNQPMTEEDRMALKKAIYNSGLKSSLPIGRQKYKIDEEFLKSILDEDNKKRPKKYNNFKATTDYQTIADAVEEQGFNKIANKFTVKQKWKTLLDLYKDDKTSLEYIKDDCVWGDGTLDEQAVNDYFEEEFKRYER